MTPAGILDEPRVRTVREGLDFSQSIVFGITSVAGVIGALVMMFGPDARLQDTVTALVTSCLLLLGLVCGLVWRLRAGTAHDYSIDALSGTLDVRRADTHRTYHYHREQVAVAHRHGLRLICIRSHWSGQSRRVSALRSLYPEHVLLDGRVPEEDGRVYRWLYLLAPLSRGQRVRVGVGHTFDDDYERMKPYYRESGEERRVRALHVAVRFERGDEPPRVNGTVWRSHRGGSTRLECGQVPVRRVEREDGTVEFAISVNRPHRLSAYGIKWQWKELSGPDSGSITDSSPVTGSGPARPEALTPG